VPSLTLASQPGFTAISTSNFDAGNAASDADLKALNGDVQFAAVRNEQFTGFYQNGETVALPVSPADGYTYTRAELVYSWSFYWTGSCSGTANGTQTPPGRGAGTGKGTLLGTGAIVDSASGVVTTDVSYFDGTQTNTHDGILYVITHAQRNR
jgi:hypothetical protein